MGFWKTLGKIGSIAAPIVAAPFTGGVSLALIGAGAGAANRALSGASLRDMLMGAGLGAVPGVVKAVPGGVMGAASGSTGAGGLLASRSLPVAAWQNGVREGTTMGMQWSKLPWDDIIRGGVDLSGAMMGNRAQSKINQQSLAQQLQMFQAQQAFLQQQAAQDQRNWEAQQAEDTRRYNEMLGMQKGQWEAQQQLRAPYRAASRNLLDGAFGGGAINRYPGTLGNMLQRG